MSDTAINKIIQYGTAAARAAFTPSPAAGSQVLYLWYDTDAAPDIYAWDGSAWVQLNAGGGGSVSTTGSPTSGQLAQFSGASSITGINCAITPQGRLTLTTATPWLTANATAQTTVYYTPAVGNCVPVYDGTDWQIVPFTELSQATTDSTKSPAACTTNSNYDLFVWSDGGTLRCTRGPAWSSDTARGTGAGTTELEYVNGILMNKIAITNGPGADRGVYVGTIRTNGSSQVDMIFGGSGAAGGESTILGIWNMYNQKLITLQNFDNTDNWTYTTDTWRIKNNNNANKISFINGWKMNGIEAFNLIAGGNSTVNIAQKNAMGLNSTSAVATACVVAVSRSPNAGGGHSSCSTFRQMAPLGFNYVAPLERSAATGTSTWYGASVSLEYSSLFVLTTMF